MAFGDSLIFRLGMDSSKFQKEGKKAKTFAGQLGTALKAALGPATALAFLAALRNISKEMDRLNKTAQKIGVEGDWLQEIQFGAERSGVAVNATNMGLQRFGRRLAEVKDRGTGPLKASLDSMGISLTDAQGRAKTTEQVFLEYADGIAATTGKQEQLLHAFRAFDSEGVALVNLMRQGSDGIRALGDEARALGKVIESDTLDKFSRLEDQMTNVMSAAKGTFATLVGGLLTFGERIGQGAAMAVNAIQGIETTLEPLPGVVGRVADAHAQVNEHLQDTAGLLDAVAALEKFRWEQTFEGATIQEKINLLREKEMQLNNAALDATLQTAEGIRAQLEAERARAQINELLAELAEQEAASQSDAAGEERERLQTTRERAQATQTALAAELSGQQSITRELAEQAQLAERKLAAAKEHMIVSQVFNGPSTADLFAKSDAELQQMARVLQGDIAHTQSTFRRPWGFVGDAPGTGTLQNQLDRIQGELAERQRFAQVYGMAGDSRFSRDRFAPAEFERRLAQFNQGTEKIDETNALLRDIRAHVRPEPIIISGTPGG